MIVSENIEEGSTEVRTDGCSCCSCTYSLAGDKNEILSNLKDQYQIMKKVLDYYKISIPQFKRMIEKGEV